MPQMSPMNWLTLYIFFVTIYIFIIMINYYMFLYNTNKKNLSKKISYMNWKW
uniref:ATP synthase complex subunit 8 n=1 Tax=Melanobaris laticollis TaxID=1069881 RepID=J9PH43_9CUCU|nr:ATP synthase F0 subunit 8 [Melanobaris laticollis]